MINAVYWFRTLSPHENSDDMPRKWWGCFLFFQTLLMTFSFLSFYYAFKFILILWMSLPMTMGAQLVFRSFIHPVFSRFFTHTESTSANLRGKADSAMKSQ